MTRTGEPIQGVIAERLHSASIRQTRSVAHIVIDIVGLIDLATGRGELMQDVRDL